MPGYHEYLLGAWYKGHTAIKMDVFTTELMDLDE